jgi:hypothetical protein
VGAGRLFRAVVVFGAAAGLGGCRTRPIDPTTDGMVLADAAPADAARRDLAQAADLRIPPPPDMACNCDMASMANFSCYCNVCGFGCIL